MKNDLEKSEKLEEPQAEERLSLNEQLVRILVLLLAFAYSYILLN